MEESQSVGLAEGRSGVDWQHNGAGAALRSSGNKVRFVFACFGSVFIMTL